MNQKVVNKINEAMKSRWKISQFDMEKVRRFKDSLRQELFEISDRYSNQRG